MAFRVERVWAVLCKTTPSVTAPFEEPLIPASEAGQAIGQGVERDGKVRIEGLWPIPRQITVDRVPHLPVLFKGLPPSLDKQMERLLSNRHD